MAFGITRWIAADVVALAAMAVWLLPPGPPDRVWWESSGEPRTAARQRERHLRQEIRLAHDLLVRARVADSLTALMSEADPERERPLIGVPEALSKEERELFEEAVSRKLEGLGELSPEVTLGFVLIPREFGGYSPADEVGGSRRALTEAYVDAEGARAHCVIVRWGRDDLVSYLSPPGRREDSLWDMNLLGPCRFYARHGPPGEQVQQWLEDGAYRMTEETYVEPPAGVRDLVRRRRSALRALLEVGNLPPRSEACLAGDAAVCRETVLQWNRTGPSRWYSEYRVARVGPVAHAWSDYSYGRWRTYDGFERSLVSDLEREFGRERFRRFWKSPEEVEMAFQAAFGMPLGEWVMEWARARLGTLPRGPRLPWNTGLLSLATLALMGLAAAVISTRRTVG